MMIVNAPVLAFVSVRSSEENKEGLNSPENMRVNIELYVTVLSELRSLCNFKIF
jgi:hypothetical protein